MGRNISLTPNELEIMEVMWEAGHPISRTEIIDMSPDRSWKTSSIHILLNKMLEKQVIKVDGFVRTGKNYGRTYSPDITKSEYLLLPIKQNIFYKQSRDEAIIAVFAALLEDEAVDEELIEEVRKMIQERRRELREEAERKGE